MKDLKTPNEYAERIAKKIGSGFIGEKKLTWDQEQALKQWLAKEIESIFDDKFKLPENINQRIEAEVYPIIKSLCCKTRFEKFVQKKSEEKIGAMLEDSVKPKIEYFLNDFFYSDDAQKKMLNLFINLLTEKLKGETK